jgi:hypothetical protein
MMVRYLQIYHKPTCTKGSNTGHLQWQTAILDLLADTPKAKINTFEYLSFRVTLVTYVNGRQGLQKQDITIIGRKDCNHHFPNPSFQFTRHLFGGLATQIHSLPTYTRCIWNRKSPTCSGKAIGCRTCTFRRRGKAERQLNARIFGAAVGISQNCEPLIAEEAAVMQHKERSALFIAAIF